MKTAAAKAVAEGFLLQADADKLIAQAAASNVLVAADHSQQRVCPDRWGLQWW